MKPMSFEFASRRSMVIAQRGMVAASNPLASQAGLAILRQGGNAADAAIAAAAVMNVVAPASTGIGGDCFALYYHAEDKKLYALNGSGRAPAQLSINYLAQNGISDAMPERHAHAVTVPGAARGWEDLINRFGTLSLADVLSDAIHYAENGFAVSPVFGTAWQAAETLLQMSPNTGDYLPDSKPPQVGQMVRLPGLASTFRAVAEDGAAAFYEGQIAESIVQTLAELGGVMTLDDLKNHQSTWEEPIGVEYGDVVVCEHPPNGQGLAALIALNILKGFDLTAYASNSPQRIHLMVEAMRLAFADARQYIADLATNPAPLTALLSDDYADERRKLISMTAAMQPPSFGVPNNTSDTIYLCVIDKDGNACSFINSLYMGFGSGIVAKDTGVFLQNRGANFVLDANHPNALAGGKRPYHTIIPGMMLKDGDVYGAFGVMGGFMQPQGHIQVINALIDDHINPQEALDRPRWCLTAGTPNSELAVEDGLPFSTIARLAELGHPIKPVTGRGRNVFGSGQIILRDSENGVLYGGSDPRKDGLVAGF